MTGYSFFRSRIFQWMGILFSLGLIAVGYWYFQVYAGYKTNVLSPTGSLTTGLVGYWPFDQVSVLGTTALDRSTSKYNGTLVSSPPVANGQVNQALDFDGSADYVTMGDQSNLDFDDTADFSMSGWFYRDTFTTADVIAAKRNDIGVGETGYSIDIEATDQLALRVSDGSSEFRMYTNATFTTAQWKHFTVVFDQDSAANTKFYIDGQAVSTSTAGTITSVGSLSNAIAFMVGSINGTNPFDGKIDEVRMYNRVLTATEAQLLYEFSREGSTINSSASQAQGTGRLDSGLAGYWAMDDGSGTSVTDSSTNANTGTLTGGSSWGAGQIGSAVDLDGTDDYVDMGDLFYSDAFTVCAWVKADVIDANSRNIVVKRNTPGVSAGSNEWTLNASTSGFTFTTWTSASVTALNITGSTVPTTATWYHVCGVEHGNGRTGYIYLNGAQNASGTQTAALWDTADRVQIGARSADNVNRYWNGLVDEVRVYNRGLSADEVSDLYRLSTPTAVDTGLKGYWSFNGGDISGTATYDRSGAGNTGTLTNGPTVTPGKIGQALNFDGTNDFVSIANESTFDFTSDFSLSVWMKTTDAGYNAIIGKTSGSTGWDLGVSSGEPRMTVRGSSNIDTGSSSNRRVDDGQWHLINAVVTTSAVSLYVDGVLDVTVSGTWTSTTNDVSVVIGNRVTNDNSTCHPGGIDEVRIYNRVLTTAEIKGLYAAGQSDEVNTGASQPQGGSRLDSGLAGYWPLDNGSGTSATDLSTNGNTGTLTASPTWSTGQIGGAVTFNDNYINIPDSSVLDAGTRSFSWSFWMKTAQDASSYSWPGIVAKEHNLTLTPRKGWISYLDTSSPNKVKCAVMYNDQSDIATSTNALNDNTWHHISCVRNVEGNRISIYVDGTLNETIALTNTGSNDISNSVPLEIGARNEAFSTNNGLVGQVDEVRVYSRALLADEISDLYRLSSPTGTETGLKGYWSFNGKDISGTTAYDRSGAGNTGTLTGGPSVTPGKVGQALLFDGTDDFIAIPNTTSINPSYITVAAWIKTSTAGQIDQIFTKDNSSIGRVWQFRKSSSNILEFIVFRDSDDTNSSASGSVTLSDNNWHHVVGTWDGTTIKVFVDGVQDGSGTAFSGVLNASQPNNAYVGYGDVGDGGFFGGVIDEVRIYNRALADAEITALYNQGR